MNLTDNVPSLEAEHKVWEILEMPEKTKLIKSLWVYALKEGVNKEMWYKTRLAVAGFNQIKNKHYAESYSPGLNIDCFRLLIAPGPCKRGGRHPGR